MRIGKFPGKYRELPSSGGLPGNLPETFRENTENSPIFGEFFIDILANCGKIEARIISEIEEGVKIDDTDLYALSHLKAIVVL